MSYSLSLTYSDFKKEVEELNRIVIKLSNNVVSIERDTHIEGCFIRLVVCWEAFSEEYFLRCMCTARTESKRQIKHLNSSFKNTNDAFKKLNTSRRDREKDYLDWLDYAAVKQRIDDFFRKNSRVQNLVEAPDKLYEIRIIRNAIAHRSTSAIYKFENFVKDQLGYLSSLNPTTADLLIMKKRTSEKLVFLVYSDFFLSLSKKLTLRLIYI